MKEHIQAAMVNEICDTARRYHNYGCLRALMVEVVERALKKDAEYWEPMNKAPKDGTRIIGWMSSQKGFQDIATVIYFDNGSWRWADDPTLIKRQDLIHGWLPFPNPPKSL